MNLSKIHKKKTRILILGMKKEIAQQTLQLLEEE